MITLKDFLQNISEADDISRSDYKLSPSGRKTHKFITFKSDANSNVPDTEKDKMKKESLDELSTDLLARYKKSASADATAADKAGDYEKGHKRFKGINKATNKQFDNDMKKYVKEDTAGDSYEEATAHKEQADKHEKGSEAYHMHMASHHETMGRWHESKGRSSSADKEFNKADSHHEQGIAKAMKKEQFELAEKLTVGGGTPVKGPGGVVSNTPPKKKPDGAEIAKPVIGSHEPRKSNQVSSAMDRLRASMDVKRKAVKEAAMTTAERDRLAKADADKYTADRAAYVAKHGEAATRQNTDLPPSHPKSAESLAKKKQSSIKEQQKGDSMLGFKELIEKMNLAKASMGDVIKDFKKSDAPQFAGKSEEKKRQMAIAAKLEADRAVKEELKGNQHKLDKNKNGKLDAHDFKLLRKEEEELEEAAWGKDKMANLKAAHDRHMEKAVAANKAGDHDAVKVHQSKMGMIKTQMQKMKQNEEVELDEKSEQARKNKMMKNMMDTSRGARFKLNNPSMTPKPDSEHKTPQAHNKAIGRALRNEDLEEQAPVAPSLGVHRVAVTTSEPDHPMVSKRKETTQRFVKVTTNSKERAIEQGKKHFAKKGFKVHSAEHAGMMHEEVQIDEANQFKSKEDAIKYAKEKVKTHRDPLDGIEVHAHSSGFDVNHTSNSSGRDSLKKMGAKHVTTVYKEETEFDNDGDLVTKVKSFSQFMEELLEYTPGPGGVTRVQGRSYGAKYHDPEGDDDADDQKAKPAKAADEPSRGRGRPSGTYGGAYKPRSDATKAAAAAKAAASKAANKKK